MRDREEPQPEQKEKAKTNPLAFLRLYNDTNVVKAEETARKRRIKRKRHNQIRNRRLNK